MYISQTASSYIKHSKQNELKHRATNIPNSDQPPVRECFNRCFSARGS